jgi:ketosteroid isomerase-like protein
MTAQDLAERVQRIEDRFAIQDLAIQYCIATDLGDRDALRALFTDDARAVGVTGGDEVVDLLHSVRSGYGRTIHTPQAHLIEFADADHATGLILSHAELDIKGRSVQTAIRYHDEYERCADGKWRFAARTLKFGYALPVEEMAESMTADDPVRWPGTDPAPADDF